LPGRIPFISPYSMFGLVGLAGTILMSVGEGIYNGCNGTDVAVSTAKNLAAQAVVTGVSMALGPVGWAVRAASWTYTGYKVAKGVADFVSSDPATNQTNRCG
jgi:hypothetical protein